jgi:hypothetical protein
MSTPRIYAEWLPLLDRFRNGDDSVLPVMQGGTIEWTNIVAERWTAQVAAALTARVQVLGQQLQTGLNRATSAFAVSRSIIDARRGLGPLKSLASLPCVPEDVRKHLLSELDRFIQQTQESLEKSARLIQDNGRILKAVRDNPLTAQAPGPESQQEHSLDAPITRGRRVIL